MRELLSINDPKYLRRLAIEIKTSQFASAPYYKCPGSSFNGRRILGTRLSDGVLIGRSLNGEEWPLNPEMIFDSNGNQVCASRDIDNATP